MAELQIASGPVPTMEMLKLVALDEEDLAIISAHVQDAVMKVEHLDYAKASSQFILTMNRFAWEAGAGGRRAGDERRLSVLNFARVTSVKAHRINPRKKADVLSLLAIRFLPSDPPGGAIELVFAGDASIRLDVECIEARLTDTGGAWAASSRPAHRA
jgi:Protein of unknown function (DUF2948)